MPLTPEQEAALERLRDEADRILQHIMNIAPFRAQNMFYLPLTAEEHSGTSFRPTRSFLETRPGVDIERGDSTDSSARKALIDLCREKYHEWATSADSYNPTQKEKRLVYKLLHATKPTEKTYSRNFIKTLRDAAESYQYVSRTRSGVCGRLSLAAFFYATLHSNVPVHIAFGADENFDHTFLILGELPRKYREGKNFSLFELPDTCLIVDPWTGCKFPPSKAAVIWADVADKFNWSHFKTTLGASFIPKKMPSFPGAFLSACETTPGCAYPVEPEPAIEIDPRRALDTDDDNGTRDHRRRPG